MTRPRERGLRPRIGASPPVAGTRRAGGGSEGGFIPPQRAGGRDAPLRIDQSWLNDRSEFQRNFVSGQLNRAGLRLHYALERGEDGRRVVVTGWTPGEEHVGFPGVAHGGLVAAVLDDVMGRLAVLRRRWVVTARMEVRYRAAAPLGVPLRFEAWETRHRRMAMQAEGRALLPDGTVVSDASATFLPLTPELERQMVERWPGFAEFLGRDLL